MRKRRTTTSSPTQPNGGATTGTLNITDLHAPDADRYELVANNGCAVVGTRSATLGICIADFDCSGTVNTLDVLSFLNASNAGDSHADLDGNGGTDTLDVLAFLNAWNAGC